MIVPFVPGYDLSTLPAVFRDMPEEVYHRTHPVLSHSGMKKLLGTCPEQFIYEVTHPKPRTDAMEFGDLYHKIILERRAFDAGYAPMDENASFATKAGKEQAAEIVAAGKRPLRFSDWKQLHGMAAAINHHPIAGKLFARSGDHEISLFWVDPMTGVVCRCRIDFAPHNTRFLVDLKSTEEPAPFALSESMDKYAYHIQAPLYEEGAYYCNIRGPDATFVFVSQQKTPPYLVTVWTPGERSKKIGRRQITKARMLFADCLAQDHWPAYADDVIEVELPERRLRWYEKEE